MPDTSSCRRMDLPVSSGLVTPLSLGRHARSFLRALLLTTAFAAMFSSPTAYAAGLFIEAADRVDAIYDGERNLVYVSTGQGRLLRFDVASGAFLPPLSLSTSALFGLAISPDGTQLAVADSAYVGGPRTVPLGTNGVHLVDLDDWTARRIEFDRSRGETGTFMVEFLDAETLVVTSLFSGSGWVPMRRVDLETNQWDEIASVRQSTMLSMAADGSRLVYAENNTSSGAFGLYDPITRSFAESGTGWFAFEAAISRDGAQLSIPSYSGTFVYDQDFNLLERIGVYARSSPLSVAYHPTEDIVYHSWWGTNEGVQAYDVNSLIPVGVVDDDLDFGSSGNHAFGDGRLRVARDGSGLSVTVPGGVKLYAPISFVDDDPDTDGVLNRDDNCPNISNPDQADTDENGVGDACNDAADRDGDEWEDAADLCPDVSNPSQRDTDGNRIGDACNDFEDADGDDWADRLDNCELDPNDQTDADNDGLGDECDPFPNRGDHVLAQCEVDLEVATTRIVELEGELAMCVGPTDEDGDGVPDEGDGCPGSPWGAATDSVGCSVDQFCEAIPLSSYRNLLQCFKAKWQGPTGDRKRSSSKSCKIGWRQGMSCVAR